MKKIITKYTDLKSNENYEFCYEEYLKDVNTTGIILRHKKSGARICLLSNNEENKVFCIGFRTTPENSTGAAHIIEHTVLCGSKNYPSRDPFIQLAKGSLNTFLNAITWPDKTTYPVASCNDKDFENLMHVYMDAVFYPNLYYKRQIFEQEGWHYEMESPDDELKINGVVYSEMKGAMSSPDRNIFENLFTSLMPDTTYAVNSGGDPDVIPTLTYEAYLDFHRRYYHPSNSYIFLYGDMDMDERLEFIDREYLSSFDAIDPKTEVKTQEHWQNSAPKAVTEKYAIGSEEDEEGKAYFGFASLAGSALNPLDCRAYGILSNILIEAESAPVKIAMAEEGIGEEVYGGIEDVADMVFTVIAKNANVEDKDRFYSVLMDTLKKEVEKGINEKAILASLNRMEFEFREMTGGGYPLGLMHIFTIMGTWLYDEKAAFAGMHVLDDINELRKRIGTGYYEKIVKDCLIDNGHTVLLTMLPEKGLNEKKENELREKLSKYKASLSPEEIDAIVKETEQLKAYQSAPETEEEKKCIPSLERKDIKREGLPIYNREGKIGGFPAVFHDIDTHGITYITLNFDIGRLKEEYVPYIGLLADLLCIMDTDKHTYSDIDVEVRLNTGDVEMATSPIWKVDGSILFPFLIRSKVMPDKVGFLFDMLGEVLTETKLGDKKRLLNIINELKSEKKMTFISSGHTVGMSRAASYFDEIEHYNQKIEHIDFYLFLKDLSDNFTEKADEIISNLKKVASYIFDSSKLSLSVASDEEGYKEIEKALPVFAARIDSIYHEAVDTVDKYVPCVKNEGIMIPSQVSYVCRAGILPDKDRELPGSFQVVNNSVRLDYLYRQIRISGGAYGAGCRYSRSSNCIAFFSYRDPNLRKTDDVYVKTGDFIRNTELDEETLTRDIIGAFSAYERPLAPAMQVERSYNAYLSGDTYADINRRRAEMLDITEEEFRGYADLYDKIASQRYICTVGSEKAIKEDSEMFDKIFSI